MYALEFLDYLIIFAVLLLLIGVGLYFTKKGGEDMDAFFVSGRSLPWYIGGTSMIATSFAADTPLWVSALVRSHGIHYIWQFWAPLIGSVLAVVYFGRKWRRMAFVTDVEFMETRYGGRSASVLRVWTGAWGALVICPVISAWVIKAMETIGREAMGLPPESRILMTIGVVIIALIMCGFSGLFGVVYTDFIQFILATFGTVMLAVYSVQAVGGLDVLIEKLRAMDEWGGQALQIAPSIGSGAGQMSAWNALGFFGFLWIGVALSGAYQAQRLLASKDAAHASYATLLHTMVYYGLMAWPWIIVALCSLIIMPELNTLDESAAYPRMIVTILPVGLRGLLIAALLAAFISTISTLFNWGSSYLVNDIYRRFLNPKATEKNYVVVARTATAFMAVSGACISLLFDNIQQLLTLFYVLGSAAVVPGVLRWLWWRINGRAEIAALVAGWIVAVLLLIFKVFDDPARLLMGWDEDVLLSSAPDLVGARMFFMVLVVGIVSVVTSYLTKPEEMDRLKAFAMRATPFTFGWRPVISQMEVVYIDPEPFGRTMLSWMIGLVSVCSILVGVGKLLLGPRPLGVGLICLSAVCLYITIRRIRTDCRKDVSDAVAAKLDEAGKDKKIINQDLA